MLYELKVTKSVLNDTPQKSVCKAEDIVNHPLVKEIYENEVVQEVLSVVLLDKANKPMCIKKIGMGGVSGTIIDNKLVAFYAVQSLASGVIIIHNHPSGTPQPSKSDLEATRKLQQGLKFLDIMLLDHIILADKEYFSFTEECSFPKKW